MAIGKSASDTRDAPAHVSGVLAAVVLLAAVMVAHGGALGDGLFFDDYWHRAQLRDLGWSWDDHVEAATFDLPGRLAGIWWQESPLQWRYARPVAMFFMKVEYHLTGGSPVGVHACGLAWHWATCLLLYRFALWALRSPGWALFAAVFYAIYPHHVFAVSWTAARNALTGGFFLLAALCVYAPASLGRAGQPPARFGAGVGALVLALWLAGLFSRETGVVFPMLAVALDLSFGGWRHVLRRWPFHLTCGLMTLGYLYWRLAIFPRAEVPDIYFTAPSGPLYALWAASKLLHMIFALTIQTPMFYGLASHEGGMPAEPVTHLVMLLLLAAVFAWYLWATRGVTGRWLWPLWMVAALAPVVPVFVMPHFAYLPALALAVAAALSVRALPIGVRRGVAPALLLATLFSTIIYRVAWRGIVRSEQLVYADVLSQTPRPADGSRFFFINLPVAGIYAAAALREAWGVDALEGHVLTFAPHPLIMEQPTTITRLNEHEFELTAPDPGYFAGASGRMMLGGMRPSAPLGVGERVRGELFDVLVLESAGGGLTRLRFSFHRPLNSPDYHFFLSDPVYPARRVHFEPEGVRLDAAADSPVRRSWLAERERYFDLLDLTARLVRSNLYLTGSDGEEAR